ncbi:methyltransferase domain-containing protein [Paraburkholderia adhaesiva]|uniref:methyltransferase domain-containing protein n=1 Tax=Paraburkholderia adhaesiva TaxID=2883244 RepID=UPI001F3569BD|nr:methyltransferase domain-containing protein [Paraburkholderia adhaesiva]
MTTCWCGSTEFLPFSDEYAECCNCGTLVLLVGMPPAKLIVEDDDTDFYGKAYWLDHQSDDFGYPDIYKRARADLTERNLYWLKVLLKYRLPGAKILELGCSHGSFVALMRLAGYDASGVEMSPWVVEFGKKTFGVPIFQGPVENLDIPAGSLDVIALMDVLEHLPDPVATMAHCLKLLKPDGLLLIQTPQFKQGMNYRQLVETQGVFLQQLKSDEHLYLFTDSSATRLFQQLGAEHIRFEPAIFGHYDMFFAVSRVPLPSDTADTGYAALETKPQARMALALLDIYSRETAATAQLMADKAHLIALLESSEADRAARLRVIEAQGNENVNLAAKWEASEAARANVATQLEASEADRAARLKVIEARGNENDSLAAKWKASEVARVNVGTQLEASEAARVDVGTQLKASEAARAELDANWWVRVGRKLGIVSPKRG